MRDQANNIHAYRRSQSDRDAWLDDDDDDISEIDVLEQQQQQPRGSALFSYTNLGASSKNKQQQQQQQQPPPPPQPYQQQSKTNGSSNSSDEDPFAAGLYRRNRGCELRASTEATGAGGSISGISDLSIGTKSGGLLRDSSNKSTSASVWKKWMLEDGNNSHWPIVLISCLVFVVLAGAGIALFLVIANSQEDKLRSNIMDIAEETGEWFAKELDLAILPLFSMAQFATELETFIGLPDKIKSPGEPGALPFLEAPENSTKVYRNVSNVCDQPDLVKRFTEIASGIKRNAKMDGVLHNIQLAPQGVICLLHPMNNTEDFKDGKAYLDNSGAWGIDLLHDPFHRYIARQSLKEGQQELGIVGPRRLFQCPTCGMYFIVRLPIASPSHYIDLDGDEYPRWGFTTALINWDALVERSDVHKRFKASGYDFRLTRTDRNYNDETEQYDEEVVVLAESDGYGTKTAEVSTALQTTNNEWVIVIQYESAMGIEYVVVIMVSFIVAFFIAGLVYTVLCQKQTQTAMLGITLAEKGKVELERHLTAALAHELRNPLGAIDSALATMPNEIPAEAKELVNSMSLCSNFMQSILNNLLDSRKLEEGKMSLLSNPLSLKQLVEGVRKMMLPAVNQNVKLIADVTSIPPGKEWVFGDFSRLQQVLTNTVSNSCKYTRTGSITISACWMDPSSPEVTHAIKNRVKKDKEDHHKSKKGKSTGGVAATNEEWVKLMCRDTGPGIPKEDQANLFNRFTTRGGAPGSGLGLAIARQIVDLAGGTIHFESDPTVKPGTDCIVLLPMKVCQGVSQQLKPEEVSKASGEDTSPLQEPLRILITDDIKMNRVMLKRRFEKCIAPNCTIKECSTGEEALKICEVEESFDVIVMDQYMQEASGVMVGTDVIIAMRRSKIDAVMIGCSGNDLDDKFVLAGADIVWKKPIPTNTEIITSLRRLLAERGKV